MDPTAAVIGSVVALVLWVAALALRGETGRSGVSIGIAALLPLAAVLATHLYQGESLVYPPKEFLDAALLAGAVSVPLAVVAAAARGWAPSVGLVVLFAAGAATLFFKSTASLHERYWDGEVLKWVGGLTAASALAYAGRLGAEAMGRTTESALAVGLAAVGAAPALGWSGTGVTAMDVAAVSASAGLFGLLTVWLVWKRSEDERSLAPVGRAAATTQAALFVGFLGNGALYSELPMTSAAMLLAAPLVTLLPARGIVASLVRLTIVAAVVGASVYMTRPEPNPYGY